LSPCCFGSWLTRGRGANRPPAERRAPLRRTRRLQTVRALSQVILLSLTASLNPTLVAATTVMLLLDKPAKLMMGYLLGAYITSITLGLVIVFSLSGSSASNTTENTLSPAVDIGLGAILLAISFVLYTGRAERLRERRQERRAEKPDKPPPRWQRELSK